ncbi:MAG: glutamine--fructose-6-phosphate transaminase (isomerizing) [archaeon]|nr:glutamine--fructose-6-phosphate transaminase (isomerizing) [archaeon]
MCGIIGYTGKRDASGILFESLKKLSYRGYDSWGLCTCFSGNLHISKATGKVDEAETDLGRFRGTLGIGHTRWATHGGISDANAHPHTCCEDRIAVVHNGVIENFQKLKHELKSRGHKFTSETDTEVIPHLIGEHLKQGQDFVDATKSALLRIEGSFAIVAINTEDNVMIAARRGSPLVLGIGKDEFFAASDIPAFLEHTKKVIYLYDNDLAVINENIYVYNLDNGKPVHREIDSIEWDIEKSKKGDFSHFMLKEITEQTETIKRAIQQDPEKIEMIVEHIKNAQGVFFVACGSSYHACLSASYIFSKVAKMHINVVLGSEFSGYRDFLTDKTLVIAVSQSGETADVLDAVKTAREKGSKILSIVNVMGSSLMRCSDHTLHMNSGSEICVLSTKTYTAQLAILTLLAYTCAGMYEEGKKVLEEAWNLAFNLTSRSTREHIKSLAELLKDKKHIFTIGRDLQYPTALEAALKIKEVSYIHAEGFAGGELKHGTIALIEPGTPVIAFLTEANGNGMLGNIMEVKARGAFIVGVGPKNNEIFDYFIKVPQAGYSDPITHIIPIQILAYKLAVLRNCNPDKPRNLAKSVTVR